MGIGALEGKGADSHCALDACIYRQRHQHCRRVLPREVGPLLPSCCQLSQRAGDIRVDGGQAGDGVAALHAQLHCRVHHANAARSRLSVTKA